MAPLSEPPPMTSLSRPSWSALVVGLTLGLGAIAIVLAAVPSTLFDLDRFSVPKELALHVTALLASVIVLSRPETIELGIVEVGLLLFALWSAITALGATNWWISFRALGVTLSGIALYFAARYAANRGGRALVVWGLAIGVLMGGLTGLAQSYGWDSPVLADTRAPGGTLGNRNFMAHLMVLGLPLAGWLLATARRRIAMVSSFLLIVFGIAAIVLSRSRAAWVGCAAMVLVVTLVGLMTRGSTPRLPRGRVKALGSAVAVGLVVALLLPNRLEWKSETPYRDSLRGMLNYREGSGRGRLIQYRNSLELVRKNPVLGVGPGNWVVAYPTVTTPGDPSFNAVDPMPTNPWPSSDWVALVTERGPIGALLWLFVTTSLSIIALRRAKDPDPARGAAVLAGLALIAAVTIEGLFDAVMLLAPPTAIAMAGLGALLPPTRPIRVTEAAPRRRYRIAAILLLVFGGLGIKSVGQLRAISIAEPGSPHARLERAARFDPGSYRLRFLLAARGACPGSATHAKRLASLFPAHPWPKRLLRRCG